MAGALVKPGRRNQRGMTTAEYAVGTVATVSLVGVIIGILNNPDFRDVIWEIVKALIKAILNAIVGA